jgi:predicted transcriptional regulator of viral defense system
MGQKTVDAQAKLYAIAESQAGYFTTLQAQSVGYSRPTLAHNTKVGRFKRVAHGIYRLTQFPDSPYEDLFVAWLQTGPDSVISHDSALALYELSDAMPSQIHIIMPRTGSRRRRHIRLHTHRLKGDEITQRVGLPVTTPARTIADVAVAGMAAEFIQQAVHEAIRRGLTTRRALETQAKRRQGRAANLILMALTQKKE